MIKQITDYELKQLKYKKSGIRNSQSINHLIF